MDLEPSQLILFVQSFGIPVCSMSKLLHCLDEAVDLDSLAMQQVVVDKSYMAQLVEVQHMRGASGGQRFKEILTQGQDLTKKGRYHAAAHSTSLKGMRDVYKFFRMCCTTFSDPLVLSQVVKVTVVLLK